MYPHTKQQKLRLLIIFVLLVGFLSALVFTIQNQKVKSQFLEQSTQAELEDFSRVLPKYERLLQKMDDYRAKGVNIDEIVTKQQGIRNLLLEHVYDEAEVQIVATEARLETILSEKIAADEAARLAAEEAEARKKGVIKGKVTSGGSNISSAVVSVVAGKETIVVTNTNKEGDYTLSTNAGKYTVVVTKSGYVTYRKSDVEVKAQETSVFDIALSKITTQTNTSSTSSSSTDSTTYSKYESKSVTTSRGTYSISVLTVDLGSGKVRVVTDTAADGDCSNNCPTKSLQSYVNQHSGFAGINGTYFCPVDYADCTGKTGTFYWKIFNTRLTKMINGSNGLGEDDPFLGFSSSGKPRYFRIWKDWVSSGFSLGAGINSRPPLIYNGQNILNPNDLDDKQKSTKSNRGAIGLKGDTFYGVIARGATVIDLAAVMGSLGVDYAMNIDGGGSSALYYKGAYKVGPGRSLPNAIIFVEQ